MTPRPESQLSRQQCEVLLVSYPRDRVLSAAIVPSDDRAATGPDVLVCSDVPGAKPARITAAGRVAPADAMPADTFVIDRALLARCSCSRCCEEIRGAVA